MYVKLSLSFIVTAPICLPYSTAIADSTTTITDTKVIVTLNAEKSSSSPTSRIKHFGRALPFWTFDANGNRASNVGDFQLDLIESIPRHGNLTTSWATSYWIYNNTWDHTNSQYRGAGYQQLSVDLLDDNGIKLIPTQIVLDLPRGSCTPHHAVGPLENQGAGIAANIIDSVSEIRLTWNLDQGNLGAC